MGAKLSCCCQSLSHVQLFVISWTAACQIILSFSISWICSNSCPLSRRCHPNIPSSVVPSPLSLNLSQHQGLCIRLPKYWGFRFSISPSNEYSRLISFRVDWFDLLAIQRILESLLQDHSSKASTL